MIPLIYGMHIKSRLCTYYVLVQLYLYVLFAHTSYDTDMPVLPVDDVVAILYLKYRLYLARSILPSFLRLAFVIFC